MRQENTQNRGAQRSEADEGSVYPLPIALALAGREASGPRALMESYPRIVERMADLWGDKDAFAKYVADLVFNQRIDERQGFESEMLQDIFFMKGLHDSLHEQPGAGSRLDIHEASAYDEQAQRSAKARAKRRAAPEASGAVVSSQSKVGSEKSSAWVHEIDLMRVKAKMEMRRLGKTKCAPKKIGQILVERGCLKEDDLQSALALQASSKKKALIGTILSNAGFVSEEDVERGLCEQQGSQLLDLDRLAQDPTVAGKIPRDVERSKKIIAVTQNARTMLVACAKPIDFAELDWLGFLLGTQVEMAWASAEAINRRIAGGGIEARERLATGVGDDFKRIAKAAAKPIAERKALQAAVFELSKKGDGGVEDATIAGMVGKMLSDARTMGASDIHIESGPKAAHSTIRMRVDGILSAYAHFDKAAHEAVVSRIKISAEMDISERRRPQDGKLAILDQDGGVIEARVSTIASVGGYEAVTMRLINAAEPVSIEAVVADAEQKEQMEELLASPHGLLLVCGPTGSGKTTTLHSMLAQLNTAERKIWTVEDPVEIIQEGLVQTQAQPKIGYGFDMALRAFMRADPDVIMVGEVRDSSTAAAALEASLTGHFVLTTLHTNSACETAVRMLDLGVDAFAFADALRGIVAQRLARRLCKCASTRVPSANELDEMAREHFVAMGEPRSSRSDRARWLAEMAKKRNGHIEIREPVGCESCRATGYKGRVGVLEILLASAELKKALAQRATAAELVSIALPQGFKPLKARAVEMACEGTISLSEARAVSL